MKPLAISIISLLLICGSGYASQKKDSAGNDVDGVIHLGEGYAFILKQPDKWSFDSEAGRNQGVTTTLVPEGSSWHDGTVVIYVMVTYKDSDKQKTLDQIIQNDMEGFKQLSKTSTISPVPSQETRDKKQAAVKMFYDDHNKNREAVAYIDEQNLVVIITLTSRNKDDFEKSLTAFKTLVGSYFFVKELAK